MCHRLWKYKSHNQSHGMGATHIGTAAIHTYTLLTILLWKKAYIFINIVTVQVIFLLKSQKNSSKMYIAPNVVDFLLAVSAVVASL